ncbi:31761_t:CDS:1, partial [Gigaspora margarita]
IVNGHELSSLVGQIRAKNIRRNKCPRPNEHFPYYSISKVMPVVSDITLDFTIVILRDNFKVQINKWIYEDLMDRMDQ